MVGVEVGWSVVEEWLLSEVGIPACAFLRAAAGNRYWSDERQWHTQECSYQGIASAKFPFIRILPVENIWFALKPRLSCNKIPESSNATLRLRLLPMDHLVFKKAKHHPLNSGSLDGNIVADFPLHDRRHINRYAHTHLFSSLIVSRLPRTVAGAFPAMSDALAFGSRCFITRQTPFFRYCEKTVSYFFRQCNRKVAWSCLHCRPKR